MDDHSVSTMVFNMFSILFGKDCLQAKLEL